MTATYVLSTNIGKTRLYSKDTSLVSPRFTDEEIQEFLTMEGNDPRLAAAVSLEITATNQALLSKVSEIEGIKFTGISMSESLLAQAKALRALVRISSTGSGTMTAVKRTDRDYPLI